MAAPNILFMPSPPCAPHSRDSKKIGKNVYTIY